MADFQSPSSDHFPLPPQQRDRTGSMSLGTTAPPPSSQNGAIPANGSGPAKAPGPATLGPVSDASKQVQEVLSSEIGVSTMLNQLKASVASAKEFGLFLRKRSAMEEAHASSLKKLARMSQETMHQPDHKHGTFAQAYSEMMYIHERMAENGMQFALSLHQMHDDLIELAAIAERSRKGWKTNGLAAELRVAEIEAAMRKSKAKYDALAEEYDRARTGDTTRQTGKMFSLKTKSAAQLEEDLLRKVQGADQEYHGKVQALQTERAELVARTRPEAVRALQDLVKETDSGLALQMQKFASFNEKLLLSNGLSISPIKGTGENAGNQPRSLRDAVLAINNEKDLNDYILAHHKTLPPNHGEIKYERNPVLNPPAPLLNHQHNMSMPHVPQMSPPGQFPVQPIGQGQQQMGPPARAGTFQHSMTPSQGGLMGAGFPPGSMPPPGIPAAQQQRPSSQQHNRSFSQSTMQSQPGQPFQPTRNSALPASRFNNGAMGPQGPPQFDGGRTSQGPPQLGALPFQHPQQQRQSPPPQLQPLQSQPQGQFQPPQQRQQAAGPNPLQQHPALHGAAGSAVQQQQGPQSKASPPPGPSAPTPSRPVFGLTLSRLYERDGLAVPMVVYQCIQAVDLFGLGLEGIYRQSGSMNHINKLKTMFDTDSSNQALDFRNPESFYHDVNSVTGLLKQFFRDLPDPLLTTEHHQGLVESAKHDDDIVRRDSLHAIINSLPDPNYATLRALTLHLHRVMDNSHVNRMNSHNLAVIFGPTLMGTDPSTSIADAGWQIKVVDTILQNTYQIFDED